LSQGLGPSRAQARARAMNGILQTLLGRRAAGATEVDAAEAMARQLGDPVTIAFCIQMRSMAASWGGHFDLTLTLLRECMDAQGRWLELNEYCRIAATSDLVESWRGRPAGGWEWLERALERVRRTEGTGGRFPGYLLERARSALLALGRDPSVDRALAGCVE